MRDRTAALVRFYATLAELEGKLGGKRTLGECHGRVTWPRQGVYFFFEPGETRLLGLGLRVVRVGTHALVEGQCSTLWSRLRQHRGSASSDGGNHRGSVFRKLVGSALINRRDMVCESWSKGKNTAKELRLLECESERCVSQTMSRFQLLWLPVGESRMRGYIERNSIALLSSYRADLGMDSASSKWLGRSSGFEKCVKSGLWNSNHVDELWDSDFPKKFTELVDAL